MSRTDKDMPDWVRAEYYEPEHLCGWRKIRKYVETKDPVELWPWGQVKKRFVGYTWKYFGDCELPEFPVRKPRHFYSMKNLPPLCSWEPDRPHDKQTRGVRKKFWRHAEYHGPQRMNERLAAREVIKGNHEYEFPDGRTRHSVLWDLS